ncbi:isopenicillin N synthase family dioxygenase [Hugenholtzia roseola]|uniref:isopenicillin N synthase family dioxygenase n=1 Tax=Hugenholtzia roseola TaxID=1002 RepID=UPI0004187C98|nr:2-oxoglutarate and iron-dependent oxygenase domain-containing protein [Hugenholtzia roseola]
MNTILYDQIPSLDLADFRAGGERKAQFVKALGNAFENIGFVAIKGHGLDDTNQANLYQAIQKFFALDEPTKKKYEKIELAGQRGYVSKGRETAKGHAVPDLKEFYHIGQEFTPQEAAENPVLQEYTPNIFPDEVPEFEKMTVYAFRTLENAGLELLRAVALHLGLDETYFDDKAKYGNSILRPLHYFPIENPDALPADSVRAAAHGDINLITLLMGASADGLEVLRLDGKWIPITALPEQVVVNVGDMLSRHTNNRLKSTIHRVVNPPRELMHTSRYSIPFFMHPRSSMDLSCLSNCIDEQNPKLYEDTTAGEFLTERLIELGLLKK